MFLTSSSRKQLPVVFNFRQSAMEVSFDCGFIKCSQEPPTLSNIIFIALVV